MYSLTNIIGTNTYIASATNNELYLYHWTNESALKSILSIGKENDCKIYGLDAKGQVNFFPSFELFNHDVVRDLSSAKRAFNVSKTKHGENQYLLAFKLTNLAQISNLVCYTKDAFASVSSILSSTIRLQGIGFPILVHFIDKSPDIDYINHNQINCLNNCWHTAFYLNDGHLNGVNITFVGVISMFSRRDKKLVAFEKKKFVLRKTNREHNELVKNIKSKVGANVIILR
ncbi:hypothetical protein [uncultured Photobacterium sp.]|uniref:hypothetical protein n=1 Tax=uncultured Photobacterium sp. TaxID=173973 RepID=UPI00261B7CBD|nr:hypothetical protein [uncultured Photobacterium sp.]